MHHFKSISPVRLELQSGNKQFGSKSAIFLSCVTLKIDGWPWKTIGHLLCCFKLCASFHSHWWIKTGVTVRKRPNWVKIDNLVFAVWPWNLTDDLEKQKGTSSKQHQALCIISSPYVNSNWSYGPETAEWGNDPCDLDLWPWPFAWTSHLSMVITLKISGWYDVRNIVKKVWQTYGHTVRRKQVFLELLGRR